MMKVYAFYLPQFHRTPENDSWWGDGFTEWETAKKAVPLYEGHYQPHRPKDGYEYNLLDKSALIWQSELMKKYGVDGLIFYHYWFDKGRRILEKPAENLLKWTDIDMPFCFGWANESWMRTWDRVASGNVWCSSDKTKKTGKHILLSQKYGNEDSWKEHFEYLLPFFKDRRYICENNRPVIYIYKPLDILCFKDMKKCWDNLADEHGIPHVYFICGYQQEADLKRYDMCIYHAPLIVQNNVKADNTGAARMYDYSTASKYLVSQKNTCIPTGFAGFVGYDDTPRHKKKGSIYYGRTPELFKKQITELMAKNEAQGIDFTVINAWNEWGEGMHLEPDEKDGFSYLEQIKQAKEEYLPIVNYIDDIVCKYSDELKEKRIPERIRSKEEIYMKLLDAWMILKEQDKSLESFFIERGYKHICIYGFGMMGEHLYEELKNTNIDVEYIVDQSEDHFYPVKHYMPEDDIPDIEAMVVTAVISYQSIYEKYENRFSGRIISIEEVLNECR